MSSSGPPPVSLETTWPDCFFQPNLFEHCESQLDYSGSSTASVEQFPTNIVQSTAENTAVLRPTNVGQKAMGASGAVDRSTHNSKRHKASTSSENRHSSSPDQVERTEQRLRNSKRACAASRPTSEYDAATARELANHAHTLVERRYRERLKVKLDQLEAALSQVQLPMSDQEPEKSQECDEDGPRPGLGKRKKSDLLHDAVSYIHQSEVDLRHLSDEVKRLNDRVRLLETLVKC
jgi:Helix-loop-helix DNA-binding domain